jgi:hypothetical protein
MTRASGKTPVRPKALATAAAKRLPAAMAVAGAAALAGPTTVGAQPAVEDARPAMVSLEDRVAWVRAVLAAGPDALVSATQTPNWTNWPKWSKWSNWANK